MCLLGFEGLGDKSLQEAIVGLEGQLLYSAELSTAYGPQELSAVSRLLCALFILLTLSIHVCGMNIDVTAERL